MMQGFGIRAGLCRWIFGMLCLLAHAVAMAGPPQILVAGNKIRIIQGAQFGGTEPFCGTDFEDVVVNAPDGGTRSNAYEIFNNAPAGSDNLVLEPKIEITGRDAGDFLAVT